MKRYTATAVGIVILIVLSTTGTTRLAKAVKSIFGFLETMWTTLRNTMNKVLKTLCYEPFGLALCGG